MEFEFGTSAPVPGLKDNSNNKAGQTHFTASGFLILLRCHLICELILFFLILIIDTERNVFRKKTFLNTMMITGD
jgi:hypothetical protein